MNIHIKNGTLIDPRAGSEARQDVFIAGGKIIAIGTAPASYVANRIIDATGLIVCPGLVDLAVRLREPGFEYMATLESEMEAAIAGGITSLACPPDTDPPLDEPGLVEMLKFRAHSLNQARVYPVGALTLGLKGVQLTEMAELTDAGCVAFSQADAPLSDTRLMLRAFQYAATFDFPVWLRAQDEGLSRGGAAHDGSVATRLGLAGIPVCAETVALSTILLFTRETGARVHICRLSSAEGVEMLRQAKASGLPVSADISIHHAHLSEADIGYFDANCHLTPPLRSERDRAALREALAEGTIDVVCSDHTPVDDDAKQLPFSEAEVGATGAELLLPLTLKWARESGLSLAQGLARVTCDPARVLGVEGGRLVEGSSADICIFDAERQWNVAAGQLKSQGKNTPFIGHQMRGKVRWTLIEGQVVYEAL